MVILGNILKRGCQLVDIADSPTSVWRHVTKRMKQSA
jgi:hypothetical protein